MNSHAAQVGRTAADGPGEHQLRARRPFWAGLSWAALDQQPHILGDRCDTDSRRITSRGNNDMLASKVQARHPRVERRPCCAAARRILGGGTMDRPSRTAYASSLFLTWKTVRATARAIRSHCIRRTPGPWVCKLVNGSWINARSGGVIQAGYGPSGWTRQLTGTFSWLRHVPADAFPRLDVTVPAVSESARVPLI